MEPPFLDHVSLTAGKVRIEELGLLLTPTSGATAHGRVLFERSYLEVTSPSEADRSGLSARGWFLRPVDLDEAAKALRMNGIPAADPDLYEGEDGTWLDVTIPDGGTSVLPVLTRRVDTTEAEWPPPRGSSHPNGTTLISAVHLETKDPSHLTRVLEAVGARTQHGGIFELGGDGRVVVRESQDGREGVVALELGRSDRPPLRLDV